MSFSEARNQKNRKVSLSVLLSYGMGSTIAIIRIAILPNLQSLNYANKTCPTVCPYCEPSFNIVTVHIFPD